MASETARTMAEPTEAERPMGSEKDRTMAETTDPESQPKGSAKARTMGSLKVALTATVPAKALRKQTLKKDRISMEPGKMMASLKARWKSTGLGNAPTKAETAEAEKIEGLEAVRAARASASNKQQSTVTNLPSKSTIVDLFEDAEVVE